jgi:hypothetical protein
VFSHGDAARDLLILVVLEEQAAIWWRVVAGKVFQLVIEVLKAEADAEPRLVLFEESSGMLDIFVSVRFDDNHLNKITGFFMMNKIQSCQS